MSAGSIYAGGSTGGSESHIHGTQEHTLTIDEMPMHEHLFERQRWRYFDTVTTDVPDALYSWDREVANGLSAGYTGQPGTYGLTGGDAPHSHGDTTSSSNMPPYLTVYVWKRTA